MRIAREFYPDSVPRNSKHEENFDLTHGVCQALTADKLHKTNIKDNILLTCRSVRVKGIGLRASKVSDVTTVWLFLR
jgi:hypothetical protein